MHNLEVPFRGSSKKYHSLLELLRLHVYLHQDAWIHQLIQQFLGSLNYNQYLSLLSVLLVMLRPVLEEMLRRCYFFV